MSSQVMNILIGSGISLVASFIVTALQNHHSRKLAEQNNAYETQKWIRDKKADVYIRLAGLLDGIAVFIDGETGLLDGKSFEESCEALAAALNEHQGAIAIFVPPSIYGELVHLRAELYALASDASAREIDPSDIMNSNAMKAIKHAKSIYIKMAQDLGVESTNPKK